MIPPKDVCVIAVSRDTLMGLVDIMEDTASPDSITPDDAVAIAIAAYKIHKLGGEFAAAASASLVMSDKEKH